MLGFGKKKKAATKDDPARQPAGAGSGKGEAAEAVPAPPAPETPPKKKRFSIKKLLMILVVLIILGGGGYAGYLFFFAEKDPDQRVYSNTPLTHLTLPKEMLRFSFDHFPGLYDAFLVFEAEANLFDAEIQRIEAIAAKYPDQKKIAEAQKKIWEKGKNTLLKEFARFEKPVKEIFVLFQVNPEQGRAQIDARSKELATSAQAALKTAQEQTQTIKARMPQAPDGLIQGTVHKLKKKFL